MFYNFKINHIVKLMVINIQLNQGLKNQISKLSEDFYNFEQFVNQIIMFSCELIENLNCKLFSNYKKK